MGRLIKNHWARLITLTAGTCMFLWASGEKTPMPDTNIVYRPNCRGSRGLLLAQDILGLPHENAGSGSQASTCAANHQPLVWHLHGGVGVASGIPGWFEHPP